MKTMNCNQLGGACDTEFSANTFDEIAELSKQHCMIKFQENDEAHLKAMQAMSEMMKEPNKMAEWFEGKRKEFETL